MKHIALKLALAALLGLGACAAQTRWQKPDTTAQAAGADLTACHQSAQQEAFRQTASYYGNFGGFVGYRYGFYGTPYDDFLWRANRDSWAASQRFHLENRLTDYCMHIKGYQRVPIEPP